MNFRDTIGHASETAATGAVSAVKSIMAYIKQLITNSENMNAAQLVVGNLNILDPDVDQPSSAIELTLMDANGGFITDGQITTVGQIDIYRHRKGTDVSYTQIVNAGAMAGTGLGTLNYSYAFPSASWAAGDRAQIHVSGVQVTKNGKLFTVPRVTTYATLGKNQLIQNGLNDKYVGKLQVTSTTINLNQAASTYTLFTGTTQSVVLESLTFALPAVNVSDDATITSISIQTNHATAQTFISSADGAKANLTSEAQIAWTGSILLPATKTIGLTIAGGAADADTTCTVVATYRAVTSGGYLAV